MAQIQFSLIKEIKIGRPEHSLTPHLLRSITTTSHFCLTPFAFTHLELTEKEDDEEEMEASAPIVDDELTSKLLRQDTAYVVIDDD